MGHTQTPLGINGQSKRLRRSFAALALLGPFGRWKAAKELSDAIYDANGGYKADVCAGGTIHDSSRDDSRIVGHFMHRRHFLKIVAGGLMLPPLVRDCLIANDTAPALSGGTNQAVAKEDGLQPTFPHARRQKVPILVYHHVYPENHPELKIGPRVIASGVIGRAAFIHQIEYLRQQGWSVITTTQLVDSLHSGAPPPVRAVVLHFDNGWLDAFEVVAPILREHGMTATAYVISRPTAAASEGRPAGIRTSTEGFVTRPFLTWDNAKALRDNGWEIGAHTNTHPKLAELLATQGEAKFREEIEASNSLFEKHLGCVPAHFAYPSGSRDERTDQLLAKYYRSLRRWRFSQPPVWFFTDGSTSPLELESQNIDNTVSPSDFKRIFTEAISGSNAEVRTHA